MPWMYIVRCSDGSYYVGSTWNLEVRVAQHNAGEGARYTAHRRPVEVVYACQFDRVDEAYAAEKRVQGWSRAKREALIDGRFDLLPSLAKKDFGKRAAHDE